MIGNVPYITLQKEVGFGDIANFVLALVVAIIIPIILNSWLDNARNIKNFLNEATKPRGHDLNRLQQTIDNCCISGTTTTQDKQEILTKISCLEMKIDSLIQQFSLSFKRKTGDIRERLYSECREYWKETTGGDLMNEDFQINKSFCKAHDKAFLKFEGYLKKSIHAINQF
jgi:hypothetical protein